MNSEPVWLLEETVRAVHDAQIAEHGGPPGLRDHGGLASALAHARNLWAYGEPTLFELAAAYGARLVQNHPFVDGNKRTAYVAVRLFLVLNGYDLTAPRQERVRTFLELAGGDLDEAGLARWIGQNAAPDSAG